MSPTAPPPEQGAVEARAVVLSRIYDLLRLVVAATAVILSIWLLSDVLMVVFAASLIAVILHGLARLIERYTPLPYLMALLVVVLVIAALFVALAMRAGPQLAEQVVALRQALGSQLTALKDRLSQASWGHYVLDQVPASMGGAKQQGDGGMAMPTGLAGSLAGYVGSAFGLFGTLAVVVITALYLAATPSTYVNGALRLVPEPHRPQAKLLFETAGHALWAWSAGQALDMLVVGILSGLGLWAIGVPLALVLGVLAGLSNFVPYIGALAGALPAVIIAFSVGTTQGLETLALYVIIQFFEGNVMAPLIQKRAVDLPPGLTIIAQTAFGAILGVAGLIFATPLTAALLAVMTKATTPLRPEDEV